MECTYKNKCLSIKVTNFLCNPEMHIIDYMPVERHCDQRHLTTYLSSCELTTISSEGLFCSFKVLSYPIPSGPMLGRRWLQMGPSQGRHPISPSRQLPPTVLRWQASSLFIVQCIQCCCMYQFLSDLCGCLLLLASGAMQTLLNDFEHLFHVICVKIIINYNIVKIIMTHFYCTCL